MTDELVEALRLMALQTGKSQAEIVREAVAKETKATRRKLRMLGSGGSDGSVTAEQADEYLKQSWRQSLS